MQIPRHHIAITINGIVQHCNHLIKSPLKASEILSIQRESINKLHGIALLFLDDPRIIYQIEMAKSSISGLSTIRAIHQPIDGFLENCDSQVDIDIDPLNCVLLPPTQHENNLNKQSGDACRHSVQSPDAVGQSDTITCNNCHGTGVDKFDLVPCQECGYWSTQSIQSACHDEM